MCSVDTQYKNIFGQCVSLCACTCCADATSAAMAEKIKVANPVVDLDGDEMTRCAFLHAFVVLQPVEAAPCSPAWNLTCITLEMHQPGRGGCLQPTNLPASCICSASAGFCQLKGWCLLLLHIAYCRVIWTMIKDKVCAE